MILTVAIARSLTSGTLTIKGSSAPLSVSGTKPCTVKLRFTNDSSKRIQIWTCGFWPNHRVHLMDAAGNAVRRTGFGSRVDGLFGTLDRDKNISIELKPGVGHSYETPDLRKLFDLKPGRFKLKIEYSDLSFGAPLKVSTRFEQIDVKL